MMLPTPEIRRRTAALANEWAAEVTPRLAHVRPKHRGTDLEKFLADLAGRDPRDDLLTLFYVVIDESMRHEMTRPLAPTELEDEPRIGLGRSLKHLIYHTQVVAAPFDVQRREIPEDFVCLANEVATDVTWPAEWFQEGFFLHGLLMDRQLVAVVELDRWFGSFSGPPHAHLWTDEALRDAPEWVRAKELARNVLVTLGIEPR